MKKFLTGFFKEEEGQGMAEYALILGVLAVGVVIVLVAFGDAIVAKFKEVTANITNSGKDITQ